MRAILLCSESIMNVQRQLKTKKLFLFQSFSVTYRCIGQKQILTYFSTETKQSVIRTLSEQSRGQSWPVRGGSRGGHLEIEQAWLVNYKFN